MTCALALAGDYVGAPSRSLFGRAWRRPLVLMSRLAHLGPKPISGA